MANITPTFTALQDGAALSGWKVVWGPMANTDIGIALGTEPLAGFADKSIQAEGTFGAGGSVTAEGSNDATNFRALTDPQGVTIAITAAGIKSITEAVMQVRPHVTAGDGTTSITVTMFFRRTQSP